MPLSITATTTPRDPVVMVQASGASMSASTTPPDCPVLSSAQSEPNDRSLGTAAPVMAKSGSTKATPGVRPAQARTSFAGEPGATTRSSPSPRGMARQPSPEMRSAAASGRSERTIHESARASTAWPSHSIR